MTEGLLPGIALTSLSAVREGEHKILDRFCAALDPAFLAHMACLSDPEDAERQIVTHVAEELRGLMDNAVADESPAGVQVVEDWIRCKGDGGTGFKFGERDHSICNRRSSWLRRAWRQVTWGRAPSNICLQASPVVTLSILTNSWPGS